MTLPCLFLWGSMAAVAGSIRSQMKWPGMAGLLEQAYLGLYLGLWPSDGSRYVSFLARMLAAPDAKKLLLSTRAPRQRAPPPRRDSSPRRDSPPTPRRHSSHAFDDARVALLEPDAAKRRGEG